MDISFRLITTEEDIDQADQLLVAAYEFPASRRATVQEYWTFQPDGWWLVLIKGRAVGYGGAVNYGTFCSIGMLSVLPAMQDQGIGTALMHYIMEWATN